MLVRPLPQFDVSSAGVSSDGGGGGGGGIQVFACTRANAFVCFMIILTPSLLPVVEAAVVGCFFAGSKRMSKGAEAGELGAVCTTRPPIPSANKEKSKARANARAWVIALLSLFSPRG